MTLEIFKELKKQAQKNRELTLNQQLSARIKTLKNLKKWIQDHTPDIEKALFEDFKKPAFETQISEILVCLTEIKYVLENLDQWAQPKVVPTPVTLWGHQSQIRYENKGVVLIIAPWNYPFQLTVMPMIAAIAAGNTIVVKPSELTQKTSLLLQKMIRDVFSFSEAQCFLGDKEITSSLLNFDFDHVFFTGSTAVGRLIAEQCSKKLIPYTLELGGKSPLIIDRKADLKSAVRVIHWAKFLNAGQTCVAPDYIFAHKDIYNQFVQEFRLYTQSIHQETCTAITPRHHQRLEALGSLLSLQTNHPELIENTTLDQPINTEEIFGPLSAIHTFETLDDIQPFYDKNTNPLALYIFSKNEKFIEQTLQRFPSGGVAVNTVTLHLANHHLPFGGLKSSGQGRYHGYFGFLEFSHQRAVLKENGGRFMTQFIQPPYSPLKTQLLKILQFFTT